MAIDALEIRMARLEGAYEQMNERLAAIDAGLSSGLSSIRAELSTLRIEQKSDLASVHAEVADLRKQTTTQFYWLLTLVLSSLVIPLIRDLLR
jgi:signal transduction histidine kinase